MSIQGVTGKRELSFQGRSIDLSQLESTLRQNPAVEDCAVIEKSGAELVAYVVPSFPYVAERVEALVKSLMPAGIPCGVVLVASIPMDARGAVDSTVLAQLPLLDSDVIQRWQSRLRELPEVKQSAVAAQEAAGEERRLHLSDLIPAWKPAMLQDESSVSAGQSGEAAKESKPRPDAYADGGPLTIPADAPKTFTEALMRTAESFPNKGILHVRANGEGFFQSYPALLDQAKRILAGLQAKGMKPGDRVVLQCELLSDHFAAFWACVLGGITPVNVAVAPSYAEKNSIVNKLYNIWKLLKHPVVISSEHLVKPLTELERFFPGEGFNVLSVEELKAHQPSENIYPSKPEDLVFFQLTSGSTGIPKCIQESHKSVIAHIHGSGQYNGYTSDDVILNWLPVDHVVPTLTCNLKDVYMGCQEIQVVTNVVIAEPLRWLDLMERHKVTHSWAPNFGFKLVADRLASGTDKTWKLSHIKFLMNAGEQVTLPVVTEFLKSTAPFGITPLMMQPSFGMAEACTCMTYTNDFSFGPTVHRFLKSTLSTLLQPSKAEDATTIAFIDLGPPVPGVEIRITDAENKVVPEGKIGRFQIKGDVITRGYLYNDSANKEAFVGDGWFNSGDLGYIWKGRLALTGREKEMIIIRGANFYCYEIEDVVNALPGAQPTFTAAVSVSDPSNGTESLAIFFVPQNDEMAEKLRLIELIRKSVASNLGISPSVIVPLPKSEFCKTTSGKIQRNQMKKSLMAGQYDSLLKEVDIALGNSNTLPAWFYKVAWRPKQVSASEAGMSPAVVFADAKGLGAAFVSQQPSSILVEAGKEFAKVSANHYQINPANADDYARVLKAAADAGAKFESVIHLMTYGDFNSRWAEGDVQPALDRGIFSVLALAQALGRLPQAQRPKRLVVASSQSQKVNEGDSVDATRGMVAGLLKTIPQEMSWLAASFVDLQGKSVAADAEALAAEISSAGTDRESAWRDGQRLVAGLEPSNAAAKNPVSFKKDALYVLTGGLGGVGLLVAKHLLLQQNVRLLVLGRTPLPDRSTWNDSSMQKGVLAERIQALRELESVGDVAYEALDISDVKALQAAVRRAQDRWSCEFDGVVHIAGVYQERLLAEETKASFAASLAPKVQGTLALHQLVKDLPDAVFISFSSVYGFFGGFSIGGYSAANAFLDSFAAYRQGTGAKRSRSLAWSLWDDLGMSRGFAMKKLARSKGYYSMRHEQGIHSLLAALQQEAAYNLIGLDATKPAIRRLLTENRPALQELMAYVVTAEGAGSKSLKQLSLPDRFGTATTARFRVLEKLPLTSSGEVDLQQLQLRADDVAKEEEVLQTEVEKALAEVWTEVLGIEKVNRSDNFFDLGGHSLSAVQITFKIEQTFHVSMALKAFLEAPVLKEQAVLLEQELLSQADAGELEQMMKEMES